MHVGHCALTGGHVVLVAWQYGINRQAAHKVASTGTGRAAASLTQWGQSASASRAEAVLEIRSMCAPKQTASGLHQHQAKAGRQACGQPLAGESQAAAEFGEHNHCCVVLLCCVVNGFRLCCHHCCL